MLKLNSDALRDFLLDQGILEEEKPAKPQIPDGYRIEMELKQDRCKLTLLFRAADTDVVVATAGSWIKGNTELDIVQSISYAAHMIYKIVEQKQIEK